MLSAEDAVNLRLSSEVAVMTGSQTSAVELKSDFTCGSAAIVDDIISSTSSNFADNLSSSLAISNYVDNNKWNQKEKKENVISFQKQKARNH